MLYEVITCGEMAADPLNLLALIGMGIREFSMAAPFIPRTKAFLQDLHTDMARKAVRKVMHLGTSDQIRAHLMDVLKKIEQVN